MNKEQLKIETERFINDPIIKSFNKTKFEILMFAIPIGFNSNKGLIYNDETNKLLKKLDEDLNNYVKAKYNQIGYETHGDSSENDFPKDYNTHLKNRIKKLENFIRDSVDSEYKELKEI